MCINQSINKTAAEEDREYPIHSVNQSFFTILLEVFRTGEQKEMLSFGKFSVLALLIGCLVTMVKSGLYLPGVSPSTFLPGDQVSQLTIK